MTRHVLRYIAAMSFVAALHAQVPRAPATPVDAIVGILDAFQMHRVVALGEGGHGNEQAHRFRLSLVRDPRFAAIVNDIVVESGSARYQDVMDRFVRGENVPQDVLAHVWRDTTQPSEIWDLPIYEAMFRTVREINASLPRDRQLRVVLGDPPVEWEKVQTLRDLDQWGSRDGYAADLVQRDILARKRRALLIYGDDHLAKKTRALGATDERPTNVVGLLEKASIPVFVVHTETRMPLEAIQADVASWRTPSVAKLAGTVLGGAEYEPSPRVRPRTFEELFDAVLYLGPPSAITFARLDATLCANPAYVRMRIARLSLLPGPPPQAPAGTLSPVERFKQVCAARAR